MPANIPSVPVDPLRNSNTLRNLLIQMRDHVLKLSSSVEKVKTTVGAMNSGGAGDRARGNITAATDGGGGGGMSVASVSMRTMAVLGGESGTSATVDMSELDTGHDNLYLTPVVGAGSGGSGGSTTGTIPDAVPASPSTLDDEFTGNTLDAKWGWIGQQPGVAPYPNPGYSGELMVMAGASNSSAASYLVQDLPVGADTGGFSIVSKLCILGGVGDYSLYAGIVIGNADGTSWMGIVLSGGSVCVYTLGVGIGSKVANWNLRRDIGYLRMDWDGGTYTLTCSASPAGMSTWGMRVAPSFVPAKVGIVVCNSSPCNAGAAFDFFRYTSPAA